MGVRIAAPGCPAAWWGPCSAFNRWRNAIAVRAGYALRPHHPPFQHLEQVDIDWSQYNTNNLEGDWNGTPTDPLMVLVVHYDNQGNIHPAQAAPLADRLTELCPPEDDQWYPATHSFITALRAAHATGETTQFT